MLYLFIQMLSSFGALALWAYMRLDAYARFLDFRYLLGLGFGFVLLLASSNAVPKEFALPSLSLALTFAGLLAWISWKIPIKR